MAYDAFISYSHGDDSALADAVQRGLSRLARPWYRRSALRVFRDSTALSANPGLWTSIVEAMDDSLYLVVICSPAAAASPWVGREIDQWRTAKPEGRILPVLAAGDLVWDDATGGFDQGRSTALHPALQGAFAEEPLFVDLRWTRQGEDLSMRNPRFRDRVADLAAPIHGIPKDELVGEDIRQHRRALRLARAAVLALVLLTAGTVVGAVRAVSEANQKVTLARTVDELNADVADAEKDLQSARTERTRLERETRRAKGDADTARREAEAAEEDRRQAQAERGEALEERQSALDEAAQAQRDAEAAQQATERARSEELRARLGERSARDSEQTALEAKGAAERLAFLSGQFADAQGRRADAERDRADQASARADDQTKRAEDASRQADRAEEARADAEASTSATRLAGTALSNGQRLDRALLLANAATQVPRAPDTIGLDALLSANVRSTGLLGFLHLPAQEGPQELGEIAVSASGRRVAAAETSEEARLTGAPGRVIAWSGDDDVTGSRAVTLPHDFRCLSVPADLFERQPRLAWIGERFLLTVENLPADDGTCDQADLPPAPATFGASRVLVWNMEAAPPRAYDLGAIALDGPATGLSVKGRSPVDASPDGRRLWITYDLGVTLASGAPVPVSVVWDSVTGRLDVLLARPAGFGGEGETFGPSGRFAAAYDYLQGPVVVDLDTWIDDPARCSTPFADDLGGCFAAIRPNTADVAADPPEVQPNESGFVLPRLDRRSLTRFDLPSGRATAATPVAETALFLLATGNEVVAATTEDGRLAHTRWPAPPSGDDGVQVTAPFTVGSSTRPEGCTRSPRVPVDERLLLVVEACSVTSPADFAEETRTTAVYRLESGAQLVRELPGIPLFTDGAGRVLTEEYTATAKRGGRWGFQLWDFSSAVRGRIAIRADDRRPVLSPDGASVAAVKASEVFSSPATVEVYPIGGDRPALLLPGSLGTFSAGFDGTGRVIGVGRAQGGDTAASAVVWDASGTTPDTPRAADLGVALFRDPAASHEPPFQSAVSRDGTVRAVSRDGRTIDLVDLRSSGVLRLGDPGLRPTDRIDYLRFTRSSSELALRVHLKPSGTLLVAVRNGGRDLSPLPAARRLTGTVVDSDATGSRLLVLGPAGVLTVVDVTDFSILTRIRATDHLPGSETGRFVLSADGHRIAGTDETGRAVVWSERGVPLAVLDPPSPVRPRDTDRGVGVQFRPDGRELAVKTVDQRLLVWSLTRPEEPRLRRSIRLPEDAWARVEYSPDGRFVAVDGSYLVDMRTLQRVGERLVPLEWARTFFDAQNGSELNNFVAAPDGMLVYQVARADLAVRWRIDTASLRARACQVAGRNLTREEMERYGVPLPFGPVPCPARPPESP